MEKENFKPHFVSRSGADIITDKDYGQWLADVKRRYRSHQVKAAVTVNREMLEFYWELGRDICSMHAEAKWGSAFFTNLSLDLKTEFPQQKGFSVSTLKYAKRWYDFYCQQFIIRHNGYDEFKDIIGVQILHNIYEEFKITSEIRQNGSDEFLKRDDQIRQNGFDEFQLSMPKFFALIPWGHHIHIITKCKTLEEAIFYIHKTIEGNWIKDTLQDKIKQGLYNTQGKAITNFEQWLPESQVKLAQSVLKDPYHFNFLRMAEHYSEQDLEDALVANVTRFLMELGKGFAFVGRQMELRMNNGKSYFPDLVFYQTKLHSYVVCELKITEFIPEYAGKINFYVSAADELLRGEGDNPSIGLLICKSSDQTTVEWSFRGIDRPIGVATYELKEVVDRTFAELAQNHHIKNHPKV